MYIAWLNYTSVWRSADVADVRKEAQRIFQSKEWQEWNQGPTVLRITKGKGQKLVLREVLPHRA